MTGPKWRIFACAVAIGLAGVACTQSASRSPTATPAIETAGLFPAGDSTEEIMVDGQKRTFRLYIPPTYNPTKPAPLVINLHGLNSNAQQQEQVSQMSTKAELEGFIVVYPEGLGQPQTWHVGPREESDADVVFIKQLIEHLNSKLNLDQQKIYATGISNGAQMANRLGCDMANIIAAIAPVSGGYPPNQECLPSRPVPVVAFHGTEDRLIPYEGQGNLLLPAQQWAAGWAERNGCNSHSEITFQNGEVTGETWGNCRENAEVTFYTINGRGHSWPGSSMPEAITTQDIDATDVIWELFKAHPMP